MELYAALDVSLQKTSVCVLDHDGQTVLETVVASEPAALAACLAPYIKGLQPLLQPLSSALVSASAAKRKSLLHLDV